MRSFSLRIYRLFCNTKCIALSAQIAGHVTNAASAQFVCVINVSVYKISHSAISFGLIVHSVSDAEFIDYVSVFSGFGSEFFAYIGHIHLQLFDTGRI